MLYIEPLYRSSMLLNRSIEANMYHKSTKSMLPRNNAFMKKISTLEGISLRKNAFTKKISTKKYVFEAEKLCLKQDKPEQFKLNN